MVDAERPRIAVLGAGAWGTALAAALARNGMPVVLWGRDREAMQRMRTQRENARYLPGQPLSADIEFSDDLAAAAQADILVFSTPSHTFRELLRAVSPRQPFLWSCKGLEPDSLRMMHEVVAEELERPPPHGMISGPSFAREVAAGMPTALTIASTDTDFAERAVHWFHGGSLRAYSNPDVVGVEIGAALKNVLAIACGVSDGLGFGANARAAVITRGLAELMRLGERMGGRRETFMGLAGLGDLVLTCTDDQSRNRRFGLALARGLTVDDACAGIGQAVEGLRTTRAAAALARQYEVEMPIVDQVHAVLYADRDPREAVQALLERDPKREIPHAAKGRAE